MLRGGWEQNRHFGKIQSCRRKLRCFLASFLKILYFNFFLNFQLFSKNTESASKSKQKIKPKSQTLIFSQNLSCQNSRCFSFIIFLNFGKLDFSGIIQKDLFSIKNIFSFSYMIFFFSTDWQALVFSRSFSNPIIKFIHSLSSSVFLSANQHAPLLFDSHYSLLWVIGLSQNSWVFKTACIPTIFSVKFAFPIVQNGNY